MTIPAARRLPLWVHAAALLVVLLAATAYVRPTGPVVSDEASAVTQARALDTGRGWLIPEPPMSADPRGDRGAFANSDNGQKGRSFYAKHPLYPELLRAPDRLLGRLGLFIFTAIGTWCCALLVALLSRELFAGSERTALWLAGVGSPLLFYGNVVLAHSWAAAATVGVVLLTAVATRSGPRPLNVAGIVIGCSLAGALRSEGTFVGIAVFVALTADAIRRRRAQSALIGTSALVGTAFSVMLQHWLVGRIVGPAVAAVGGPDRSLLGGQLRGAITDLFQPSLDGNAFTALLLTGSCVALLVACYVVRKPSRSSVPVWLWAAVAFAYALLAIFQHHQAVSGLFMAFPVLWFGLLLLERSDVGTPARQAVLTTCALVALAVIATDYVDGGGYQWGGRYFLGAAVPLIPFAIAAIRRTIATHQRLAFGSMAVATTATSVLALLVVHDTHETSSRLQHLVSHDLPAMQATYAAPAGSASSGRPFVVWPRPLVMQLAWTGVDTTRYLGPRETDLAGTFRQLHDLEEPIVLVVTPVPSEAVRAMQPNYSVADREDPKGLGVEVLVAKRVGTP